MKRLINIDSSGSGESAEINLSPLIDMVFLLLIFFMVTTVFVQETGVEIQKPKASSAKSLKKNSILIAVTREGRIVHGGKEISINRIRGLVARLQHSQEMPVVILADETSATGMVVQVIDQCKLGGAKQVSIAATNQ